LASLKTETSSSHHSLADSAAGGGGADLPRLGVGCDIHIANAQFRRRAELRDPRACVGRTQGTGNFILDRCGNRVAVFVAKPLQNQTVDVNDNAPHSTSIRYLLHPYSHIRVTWIPAFHAGMTDGEHSAFKLVR
jgi:hypothetical protein